MAKEQYSVPQQPAFSDQLYHGGQDIIDGAENIGRHLSEAINVAPPGVALWLAGIMGIAAFAAAAGFGQNIGSRDSTFNTLRPVAYGLIALAVASTSYDYILETKGYTVEGKKPNAAQIEISKTAENFEKATKRFFDYAPFYKDDVKRPVQQEPEEVPEALRRHNSPVMPR